MSDEERARPDEVSPSTPFDSPYFLPVMLWGFTAWFFYDGWFNPDMEYVKFNRYGFGIALAFAGCSTLLAFRETPWAAVGMWISLAAWFAWMVFGGEGWWTETEAARLFNRYALGLTLVLAAYCAWMALRPTPWARPALAAGGAAGFGALALVGAGDATSEVTHWVNRIGFAACAAAAPVLALVAWRRSAVSRRAGSGPPP